MSAPRDLPLAATDSGLASPSRRAPERATRRASVAAVIPVGPGDRSWRELIAWLDQHAPGLPYKLVFAHGDLQARPRSPAVRWIESERGRGRQQNAGAAGLTQDWLWFLHADSRPIVATLAALSHFLTVDDDVLGYFDLHFTADGPALMRLTELGARWRCRCFALPFGDQGLLLRRRRFHELGGFDESRSFGEDHALVWAARRSGLPIRRIPAPLPTSARKYRDHGWLATTWLHQRLTWSQAWQEARRP